MSTKSSAARKRQTKAQPAPPKPDPELQGIMESMAQKVVRPDGSLDAVAVLTGVHSILGQEKYGQFEQELSDYFAPEGITEVFVATWDYGWQGKLQTICGVIGAAAVLIGVCEVAGRVLDVPGLQFGTKLAGLILGD